MSAKQRQLVGQVLSTAMLLLLFSITISPQNDPKHQVAKLPTVTQQVEDDFYVCAMHPDVTSDKPGKCPKCNMKLVRTKRPETADYEIQIKTNPAIVRPGQKFLLTFSLRHPKTGSAVKDLNIVHDMPFHLFIVSQDLDYFDHIHPTQQQDGNFAIETRVPKPGAYLIYCDIFPVGGMPQVAHRSLITAGFKGDLFSSQARLVPDTTLTKTIAGIGYELSLKPSTPVAGKTATLKYKLTDEESGEPIKDLQPYLGAWGHTLILSEDASDYVHSHPSVTIPDGVDRSQLCGGLEVSFDAFLPRPGNYRIWSQFQRQGKLTTVSFTISVKQF